MQLNLHKLKGEYSILKLDSLPDVRAIDGFFALTRTDDEISLVCLECVSKRKIRKFEWILRQFKEETRRLSSAKSRVDDAEMAQRRPKLRIKEFLRHTLAK